MQRKLNQSLPIKARTEMRNMPVCLLKQKHGSQLNLPVSKSEKLSYGFSGNGFEGTCVTLDEFSHIYLSNELQYPVVNESDLTGRFDVKTTNDMHDINNIIKAVEKIRFNA